MIEDVEGLLGDKIQPPDILPLDATLGNQIVALMLKPQTTRRRITSRGDELQGVIEGASRPMFDI